MRQSGLDHQCLPSLLPQDHQSLLSALLFSAQQMEKLRPRERRGLAPPTASACSVWNADGEVAGKSLPAGLDLCLPAEL